jgi:hypothetical protein
MKCKKTSVVILLLAATLSVFSQKNKFSILTLPKTLKNNANAVVRDNTLSITLKSINEMHTTKKRVVTVFNKKGENSIDAYMYYDSAKKIISLQAVIYDAFGNEIKKIKKKDFKDVSATSGGTLYSDSRIKYLDYTAITYPYTVEFTCEFMTKNTAFIRPFYPINMYNLSVESSAYSITYPETLKVKIKEKNFENYNLEKFEDKTQFTFKVHNIAAIRKEVYSPAFSVIAPKVLVASNAFSLEGEKAQVDNWTDFGKWMYHDLIADTQDLPEATSQEIKALVKDETDAIEKAKKIYQYVQDKVRYISVQVGIGGWKPFNASKVDELGYGDCKALTNYTMALLDVAGVESYYTVVFSGGAQRNIEKDFSAMQGNHVILNLPQEQNEDIWLECTNQKVPFGFIGYFTDDRDALVITPEGGKIKHTKKYKKEQSTQNTTGQYAILDNGGITAQLEIQSKGIQYGNQYYLDTETKRDLDLHYKNKWNYINGLQIEDIKIINDKDNVVLKELIDLKSNAYCKIIGDRMLLALNAFNRNREVPNKYEDRKLPFQIKRGFTDVDSIEIKLPKAYKLEAFPKPVSLTNKYGVYTMRVEVKDESTLIYKRKFSMNDGTYEKEAYEAFRTFHRDVLKYDNSKIALIKK